MGARTALTEEQYLRTSFDDLDKEYRDGEIVERSLPDYSHSKTQGLIIAFFAALRKSRAVFTSPELRLKIRPGLYLIPDVSVFHPIEPTERVPSRPPLIAVEILSPDDRMPKVVEKLGEYRTFGVRHVWLIDPYKKRLHVFDNELLEIPTLPVPELNVELTPTDVFE